MDKLFKLKVQLSINSKTQYLLSFSPKDKLQVGDYGQFNDFSFNKLSHIDLTRYSEEVGPVKSYSSELQDRFSEKKSFFSRGQVSNAEAGISYNSAHAGAYLVHVNGHNTVYLKDKLEAINKIIALIKRDQLVWRDDYYIVTDVEMSHSLSSIMATGASVSVNATVSGTDNVFNVGEISKLNLARADVSFSISGDTQGVTKVQQPEPFSYPLFKLAKLELIDKETSKPIKYLTDWIKKLFGNTGDDLDIQTFPYNRETPNEDGSIEIVDKGGRTYILRFVELSTMQLISLAVEDARETIINACEQIKEAQTNPSDLNLLNQHEENYDITPNSTLQDLISVEELFPQKHQELYGSNSITSKKGES